MLEAKFARHLLLIGTDIIPQNRTVQLDRELSQILRSRNWKPIIS